MGNPTLTIEQARALAQGFISAEQVEPQISDDLGINFTELAHELALAARDGLIPDDLANRAYQAAQALQQLTALYPSLVSGSQFRGLEYFVVRSQIPSLVEEPYGLLELSYTDALNFIRNLFDADTREASARVSRPLPRERLTALAQYEFDLAEDELRNKEIEEDDLVIRQGNEAEISTLIAENILHASGNSVSLDFFVERDGKVVAEYDFETENTADGLVVTLKFGFVLPEYRYQGIGDLMEKTLMTAALRAAYHMETSVVFVHSIVYNPYLQKLYSSSSLFRLLTEEVFDEVTLRRDTRRTLVHQLEEDAPSYFYKISAVTIQDLDVLIRVQTPQQVEMDVVAPVEGNDRPLFRKEVTVWDNLFVDPNLSEEEKARRALNFVDDVMRMSPQELRDAYYAMPPDERRVLSAWPETPEYEGRFGISIYFLMPAIMSSRSSDDKLKVLSAILKLWQVDNPSQVNEKNERNGVFGNWLDGIFKKSLPQWVTSFEEMQMLYVNLRGQADTTEAYDVLCGDWGLRPAPGVKGSVYYGTYQSAEVFGMAGAILRGGLRFVENEDDFNKWYRAVEELRVIAYGLSGIEHNEVRAFSFEEDAIIALREKGLALPPVLERHLVYFDQAMRIYPRPQSFPAYMDAVRSYTAHMDLIDYYLNHPDSTGVMRDDYEMWEAVRRELMLADLLDQARVLDWICADKNRDKILEKIRTLYVAGNPLETRDNIYRLINDEPEGPKDPSPGGGGGSRAATSSQETPIASREQDAPSRSEGTKNSLPRSLNELWEEIKIDPQNYDNDYERYMATRRALAVSGDKETYQLIDTVSASVRFSLRTSNMGEREAGIILTVFDAVLSDRSNNLESLKLTVGTETLSALVALSWQLRKERIVEEETRITAERARAEEEATREERERAAELLREAR
ncbi:GNAT family N-acetyltransferase [bacterium]|nr:GNAT family N-acetyltransferase [bacterium]